MKKKVLFLIGIVGILITLSACSKPNESSDFIFNEETGYIIDYIGERDDVVIPKKIYNKTVKGISENAFREKGITSIEFVDTITEIAASAFYGNKLTSVSIPNSVIKIGAMAFANNNIKKLKLSPYIEDIPGKVFENNDITNVSIPARVVTIGIDAFSGNENIETVTIKGDNPQRFNNRWENIGFPESLMP